MLRFCEYIAWHYTCFVLYQLTIRSHLDFTWASLGHLAFMSLRNYLFCLVGGLLLLLTASQLFLVYWIEQTLNQEVKEKAQSLSQFVVEEAIDEFSLEFMTDINQKIENVGATSHERLSSKSASSSNPAPSSNTATSTQPIKNEQRNQIHSERIRVVTDTEENMVLIQKENFAHPKKTVSATTLGATIDSTELKQKLHKIVKQIHQKKHESAIQKVFITTDNNQGNFVYEMRSSQTSSTKLINTIQLMIAISALLALLFAFWLSAKFNQPLKALATGFNKLSAGDYSAKIAPSGVEEIKQTMQQFNLMVQRLAKLSEQEKHNNETQHLAELGEVSRGLAHTLRNPIHTIGLSIEQLDDSALPADTRHNLITTIKNKIQHIDNNIKALLTLTTSGISRRNKVPLLAVIQDIVLEYKFCTNKPQTFTIEVASEIAIEGDESEIRSVLHTLIINACEANTINKEVIITANVSDNEVQITVTDMGLGLSEDIKAQLFKPHVSTKAEGAGMGLYIAKRIVSLHYGGKLELTNVLSDSQDKIAGCKATLSLHTSQKENSE